MKGILLFLCIVGFILLLRFLVATGHLVYLVIAIVVIVIGGCVVAILSDKDEVLEEPCDCDGFGGCM